MPSYRTVDEQGDYYADQIDAREVAEWIWKNGTPWAKQIKEGWRELKREFSAAYPGYDMDDFFTMHEAMDECRAETAHNCRVCGCRMLHNKDLCGACFHGAAGQRNARRYG